MYCFVWLAHSRPEFNTFTNICTNTIICTNTVNNCTHHLFIGITVQRCGGIGPTTVHNGRTNNVVLREHPTRFGVDGHCGMQMTHLWCFRCLSSRIVLLFHVYARTATNESYIDELSRSCVATPRGWFTLLAHHGPTHCLCCAAYEIICAVANRQRYRPIYSECNFLPTCSDILNFLYTIFSPKYLYSYNTQI